MKTFLWLAHNFVLLWGISKLLKVKVKVSHSLIAVGAVGVRVSWVQLMQGGAHPPRFTALISINNNHNKMMCHVQEPYG